MPRFYAADHVATRLSHVYRSAYVDAYLLAIFAVLVASAEAYFVAPNSPNALVYKACFVSLEFVLTASIPLLVLFGRNRDWHGRGSTPARSPSACATSACLA